MEAAIAKKVEASVQSGSAKKSGCLAGLKGLSGMDGVGIYLCTLGCLPM